MCVFASSGIVRTQPDEKKELHMKRNLAKSSGHLGRLKMKGSAAHPAR